MVEKGDSRYGSSEGICCIYTSVYISNIMYISVYMYTIMYNKRINYYYYYYYYEAKNG